MQREWDDGFVWGWEKPIANCHCAHYHCQERFCVLSCPCSNAKGV